MTRDERAELEDFRAAKAREERKRAERAEAERIRAERAELKNFLARDDDEEFAKKIAYMRTPEYIAENLKFLTTPGNAGIVR